MGLVESRTCFWITRTFNFTSTRLREKLCLYKSKICQSLMTGDNKDVILDTIPQRLLSCHRTIRKSFPRLIWKRLVIIKIIVKCQSIPCHYCLICAISGDSHVLRFDFSASTATGHTLQTQGGGGATSQTERNMKSVSIFVIFSSKRACFGGTVASLDRRSRTYTLGSSRLGWPWCPQSILINQSLFI